MQLPTNMPSNRLPERLPRGVKYVVEGHGGEIGEFRLSARYVVLPTGRRINLLGKGPDSKRVAMARRTRNLRKSGRRAENGGKSRSADGRKKIFDRSGTPRKQAR